MKKSVAIAAALVLVPLFAIAQVPGSKTTYQAVHPAAKSKKIIAAGIEKAVEDMSFLTRPIARGRLEDSNIAFKTITVHVDGDKVSIQHDKRKPVVSPKDGSQITWTREDGEKFKVTQKVEKQEIIQTFAASDGKKTLRYLFGAEGKTMKVLVNVSSPKLGAPLKYGLEYKLGG
jgi:hypothetical protein